MHSHDHIFLIVDSNAIDRKSIRDCLIQLGFTVFYEASNVNQAVSALNLYKIDVVISDWGLPGASGYSFLKLIKLQSRYKAIHFIMLSRGGVDEVEKVKKSAHFGLDGYLLKPFDGIKFKILLDDIL